METLKCDECGGTYERKTLPYYKAGQLIGKYSMLVCNKCKETVIEAEVCGLIEQELKQRKLWGVKDKVSVQRVTLPSQ